MARCMSSSGLAALGAKEPVEHFLKAVELALLDVTTGFESISEDGRTRTIHQRLPRHLYLATCATQYVAQDLPENISSRRLLRLATAGGTGLSRNGDLDTEDEARRIASNIAKLPTLLSKLRHRLRSA
jgi:hypothetical protein